MSPDLPPEVRAEAGRKLRERSGYTVPAWKDLDPYDQESWAARVDAVVSVVLPAQVDALKAENARLERQADASERFANKVYVEARALTTERDQLKARVGVLTDALSGLLDNSLAYVETLALVAAIDRALAALASDVCQFCGEPASETVWCCDGAMAAAPAPEEAT